MWQSRENSMISMSLFKTTNRSGFDIRNYWMFFLSRRNRTRHARGTLKMAPDRTPRVLDLSLLRNIVIITHTCPSRMTSPIMCKYFREHVIINSNSSCIFLVLIGRTNTLSNREEVNDSMEKLRQQWHFLIYYAGEVRNRWPRTISSSCAAYL